MKKLLGIILVLFTLQIGFAQVSKQKVTLVIHGGAGTILKENMTSELEKQYQDKMKEALQAGYKILTAGGTSTEAVVATIKIMEDSPLFNAGKGAVFTNEGKNEMDASIMRGYDLNAGAVAGVTNIKNPIEAALAVMERSPHVMMAREGAEKFAQSQGIETVEPSYFYTEKRMEALKKAKEKMKEMEEENDKGSGSIDIWEDFYKKTDYKFGTVGALALDEFGNLAAATSTGGMTNKMYGRIGDSPIIGAGTYANNETCAVSSTGHGEYFIRAMVAHDISALMQYKKYSVKKAAKQVVQKTLVKMGGDGGVIALDRDGNFTFEFNTAGMYRGYIKADGTSEVFIYKE